MVTRILSFTAVLALGCASLAAAATKNIDRTVPLSSAGTIELDAHNGWIQVRTWDKPQVEIHVRIEWIGLSSSSYRYRETTVDIDNTSDRVSIRWRPADPYGWTLWSLFEDGWSIGPEVHYEITAPKTARLQIHNHNASTDIRDFAGPLDLSTHNGRTHVDFASFTQGSRVAMHNGSVEFELPRSSRFNFDSRGHHAYVHSDFPPVTNATLHGRGESNVVGTVNGGGPDLRIVCHNGTVRLHSKG